jgi:sec-independent protein translocase protein TatC
MEEKEMSFWDHLEELRGVLFRSVLVLFILMVVAFCFKLEVFEVVFAPLSSDFILYRLLDKLLISLRMSSIEEFNIQVQNIEMTAQFFTHVKVSLYVALVIAMPYIFYQLWSKNCSSSRIRSCIYTNIT